jgi:hypothetical protein
MVWFSASFVITPTMPTVTPAASVSIDGSTLGQVTGRPVVASIRLAARKGKCASAARALSAPRGSSDRDAGVAAGPTGPKSNSWLPTVVAVYRSVLYASSTEAPSVRFDSSVPWNMSPASMSSTAPASRARAARRLLT